MFDSRVTGLAQLQAISERLLDDAGLALSLHNAGDAVMEAARANLANNAASDTSSGALAASLFAETDADGSIRIGTTLDYGWRLEMGSQTRAAYPWLTAPFQEQRAALVEQIGAWLSTSARQVRR